MAAGHAVITVPSDGNCLFWASHIGATAQGQRAKPPTDEAQWLLGAKERTKVDVAGLRLLAAEHLRAHLPHYRTQIVTSAVEALASADDGNPNNLRRALCEQLSPCNTVAIAGGSMDEMAEAARAALTAADGATRGVAAEACDIYLAAMATDGVFGERLQLQVSSPVDFAYSTTPTDMLIAENSNKLARAGSLGGAGGSAATALLHGWRGHAGCQERG